MHSFRSLSDVGPDARGACVAVGNFDGVHPGHAAVIKRAANEAHRLGAPLGLVTFDPHPRRYFRPDGPAFTLTTPTDKAHQAQELGVDLFYALTFDAALAALTADQFVADILVTGLGVRHVVVGHDFHFGRNRGGSPDVLAELGRQFGFGVSLVAPVGGDDGIYSSTAVREALVAGRPDRATLLLGRPWSVSGRVFKGDQRGRTINFPTANISLGDYLEPALGVYAVRARRADGTVLNGVANLGRRPTFNGSDVRLEAHLFDFAGDLYDEVLDVSLIAFIRPERKFEGLDQLKAQIAADAEQARKILT